eukprot:CAMPEP_0206199112 /NCGR_PEP_ID=MMETSP0166-20121206/10061_1 /ASSEMBLY_ACC=CAM_ASM_000260 /TAXON_ID=95228 /ORGANISM="Vannella robusta, Strain DIVA3 518/3/11/1/6" /LENGTH=340 /DNA_ID=CAMNT_0053617139 /DNA_START=708 /DNA_END=1730 /DNA_ORIENTATION=+
MPSRDVIILAAHPSGVPKMSDFKKVTEEMAELEDGFLRVQSEYFSVDPYLRGKMSGIKDSYFVPFELNKPVASLGVGKVIESKIEGYQPGDRVSCELQWATIVDTKPGAMFQKLQEGVSPQTALSVFGLTGLTAHVGLLTVGKLEEKEKGSTVLVTGAAGATGNVVGQIAKLKGYRVVGMAGTDEKVNWLKNELQFDEVINYRTEEIAVALKEKCNKGIDVYFDNVGGEIFDTALPLMNRFGVVINCGAISTYNAKERLTGPRVEWLLITKSLRMQGFIVSDFASEFGNAIKDLSTWVQEGKIQGKVTEFDGSDAGVEHIPDSFIKMMSGKNIGKSVVKI